MKYFFLSDGWTVGRVWQFGGLWNELAWRRGPEIHKTSLGIVEQNEKLWLYQVEDTIIMVEVKPPSSGQANSPGQSIGQVVLKRLMSAEQVIERLSSAATIESTAQQTSTVRR